MRKKQKSAEQVARLVSNNRIKMMADRLAILMVICNARDEDDWMPWGLESSYDSEDCMGEHIRKMKDYTTAKNIVRMWIEKTDKRTREELG